MTVTLLTSWLIYREFNECEMGLCGSIGAKGNHSVIDCLKALFTVDGERGSSLLSGDQVMRDKDSLASYS